MKSGQDVAVGIELVLVITNDIQPGKKMPPGAGERPGGVRSLWAGHHADEAGLGQPGQR